MKLACVIVVYASFAVSPAHARTASDATWGNTALGSLHRLAYAAAQYEQATKDSDQIGCRDAYRDMQKLAHSALVDMHSMSFAPDDAIERVSRLLRLTQLTPYRCSNEIAAQAQFVVAGAAIVALRYDYAIGDQDWYTAAKDGAIRARNPLRYAESLKNDDYYWVGVQPKGIPFVAEVDWNAELASSAVNDPSIQDSGRSLKVVEVDYRRSSDDSITEVDFYRTKEAATSAMHRKMRRAEAETKAKAARKASEARWRKKLASLPYLIRDHDRGFKLVYDICRETDKKAADGSGYCTEIGSHDWSPKPSSSYQWFSSWRSCSNAEIAFSQKKASEIKTAPGELVSSECMPAPRPGRHVMQGYKIVYVLLAPGASYGHATYAEFRETGSDDARVFKTFRKCYDKAMSVYTKALKDLGVDKDGNVVGNTTKSVEFTGDCVRSY